MGARVPLLCACVVLAWWASLSHPVAVCLALVGAVAAYFAAGPLLSLPRAPDHHSKHFRNMVIAHRGGQPLPIEQTASNVTLQSPLVFPENSLAAFRWASSQACGGADAFELDVHLSKDGVPMINHDHRLFRHFESEGEIGQFTLAQLKGIKYLAEPHLAPLLDRTQPRAITIDPSFVDSERMPTLEEVVALLEHEAPHMKCMIEVKERARVKEVCVALAALYKKHPWMYTRCYVASFNPLVLRRLRQLDPLIVTSFLFIDNWTTHLIRGARDVGMRVPVWLEHAYPLRWLADDLIWALGSTTFGLSLLGANMTACESRALTENQIRRERAAGILTSTWVVNNATAKEWLLQQGVSVITDVQFTGGASHKAPRSQVR